MVTFRQKFALQDPAQVVTVLNGDTFEGCSIFQAVADTEICKGITGLTFKDCNLINVKVPDDATVIGGNTCKKSFCSHIHEDWGLEECAEDCEHSTSEEIWVEGVLVDTITTYKDGDI